MRLPTSRSSLDDSLKDVGKAGCLSTLQMTGGGGEERISHQGFLRFPLRRLKISGIEASDHCDGIFIAHSSSEVPSSEVVPSSAEARRTDSDNRGGGGGGGGGGGSGSDDVIVEDCLLVLALSSTWRSARRIAAHTGTGYWISVPKNIPIPWVYGTPVGG